MAHRYSSVPFTIVESLQSSNSATRIFTPLLKNLSHYECWVMYLNRANRLLTKEKASSGGVYATAVDVKIIMKRALELLVSSLIMVHNHPSGNCISGEKEKQQTKNLKDAGQLLYITLLDHIIIAGDQYYSFADEGMM